MSQKIKPLVREDGVLILPPYVDFRYEPTRDELSGELVREKRRQTIGEIIFLIVGVVFVCAISVAALLGFLV